MAHRGAWDVINRLYTETDVRIKNAPLFILRRHMETPACLDCVIKHLSQAMIVHEEEVPMGYPQHIYRVVGHLAEASRESVSDYPEIAGVIRDHRLALLGGRTHVIPYTALLSYVDVIIECVNKDLPVPAIPEDLKLQPKNEQIIVPYMPLDPRT